MVLTDEGANHGKFLCHSQRNGLLAIVMFEMAVAMHALAAEHGSNGVHAGGGLQSGHMDSGFHGLMFDRAPSMPPPVFNPSNPYTAPESPENSGLAGRSGIGIWAWLIHAGLGASGDGCRRHA